MRLDMRHLLESLRTQAGPQLYIYLSKSWKVSSQLAHSKHKGLGMGSELFEFLLKLALKIAKIYRD